MMFTKYQKIVRVRHGLAGPWGAMRSYSFGKVIGSFLKIPETGDKDVDALNRMVYQPLMEDKTKSDESTAGDSPGYEADHKLHSRAKFYSSMLHRYPVALILQDSPFMNRSDWKSIQADILELNRSKNLQMLEIKDEEARLIDPNHMMRLFEIVPLTDPSTFNVALNLPPDEIKRFATFHTYNLHPRHFKLDTKFSYRIVGISDFSLYADSSQLFDLLHQYQDIYPLRCLRIAKDALNYTVLKTRTKSVSGATTLSYDELLQYAKDHSEQAHHRERSKLHALQSEAHYTKFFTRLGELGFVKSRQYGDCVYLFK